MMELAVTVQADGRDIPCGRLFQGVRHGEETTSFSCDAGYLGDPRSFALAPDMPLGYGTFHSHGLQNLRAFEDCMPDRWGRNLLRRAERNASRTEGRTERTPFEADMLVDTSDATRQGAIRIWTPGGTPLAPQGEGVPRLVRLPDLLDASDRAARDLNADVRDLVAAGSSLGGTRPKASVLDERGRLLIAKFPKADESLLDDTCAWERVCQHLMKESAIVTPPSRLMRIQGRSVLLTERYDRRGWRRIPYLSGLSAVHGRDGQRYSYIELAEFIESEGADPDADLPELWRRALFSCAVGNTDNHLRNHGFLRVAGGWRLSPAFDVNPTVGAGEKYLATGLDFDRPEADARIAFEVRDYFRVTGQQARSDAARMLPALRGWRRIALSEGIPEASIERMAGNFERGITELEQTASTPGR
ncbi:MAG: type II toxin-antitoxin system HipA family toxin [Coriobacteriales bacterium]|jgi:serine/threonine-protein kinase HipA